MPQFNLRLKFAAQNVVVRKYLIYMHMLLKIISVCDGSSLNSTVPTYSKSLPGTYLVQHPELWYLLSLAVAMPLQPFVPVLLSTVLTCVHHSQTAQQIQKGTNLIQMWMATLRTWKLATTFPTPPFPMPSLLLQTLWRSRRQLQWRQLVLTKHVKMHWKLRGRRRLNLMSSLTRSEPKVLMVMTRQKAGTAKTTLMCGK